MEPFAHPPVARRRTIDPNTPVFPPKPSTEFDEVQTFANESQRALSSITIPASPASVYLPLVSPTALQDCFEVLDNSVFILVRNSYARLKEEFESQPRGALYVHGPIGIGKSHMLYLLAAEYRKNPKEYRATYINNCASWKRLDAVEYLLSELVTTFHDDVIDGKSIIE